MTSSEARLVQLTIHAADGGTELFVNDGRLNAVGHGRGRLSLALSAGIYQVKHRAGFVTGEQFVVLKGPTSPLYLPPLRFATPAPLVDTAGDQAAAQQTAVRASRTEHVKVGDGSWIFVFVRGAKAPGVTAGLSLWGEDGKLVDLAEPGVGETSDPGAGEAWAACNIRLAPGPYWLRQQLGAGQAVEQTIVAAPNRQTQVFLGQRAYSFNAADRHPDLPGAAILCPPQPGFDPASPLARLAELARIGLANRRNVLSDEVLQTVLDGTCADPMLGLFGAYLHLVEHPTEADALDRAVEMVQRALDRSHADVQALSLAVPSRPAPLLFRYPPMLRASWDLVATAPAHLQLGLPESLNSRVALLLGEGPWLVWMCSNQVGTGTPPPGAGSQSGQALDGPRRARLRAAFVDQFPTPTELAILVDDVLSVNLVSIAGGTNLTEIVFALIQWASIDPTERLRPLLREAGRRRPNSRELAALNRELLGTARPAANAS